MKIDWLDYTLHINLLYGLARAAFNVYTPIQLQTVCVFVCVPLVSDS